MAKWKNSKVIRIEDETPTTKRFWIEVPALERIDFKPGQFITMDLPIHEKRTKRWRSYSIANAPDGTNVLELCIVYLEGGLASEYFFKEVTIGTEIKYKGPVGIFTLPETLDKDLVLICTGTGLAPFRSMLWDIYEQKKPHQNIHLIFGTRYKEGILYHQDMKEWEEKLEGFSYDIALSRSVLPHKYYSGYVHKVYLEKYIKARPDALFYLCGWRNMVDEAVENLKEKLGYDKSQVRLELYG